MNNKILVFGGGGSGTGAAFIELALEDNLRLVALVRNKERATELRAKGVEVVVGDATDADKVLEVCKLAGESCTIVSTMGGIHADYTAHRLIIDTAESLGIKRFVLLTSLGCGDSWDYMSDRAKKAFGFALREKSLSESWLHTSNMDYSIIRPGGLMNGNKTGKAIKYQNTEVHGFVMRIDVAEAIYSEVKKEHLGRNIYSLIDPDLQNTKY